MRIQVLAGAVVAMLASPLPVQAQEQWTFVARGSAGYQAYINEPRSLRIGDIVEAWVRFDWDAPNSDGAKSVTMLISYDCARWSSTELSYIEYGPDNLPLRSETFSVSQRETHPVAPGTTMNSVITQACAISPRS